MSAPVAVLIIDDNPNMRKTLRNVLATITCEICEAETGEEALQKITRRWFDLIFIDNKLPGPDGIQVIKTVREQGLKIGKVFLLTGYPEENTKAKAEQLGVFHFQHKNSMDLLKLRDKVNEAILQQRN